MVEKNTIKITEIKLDYATYHNIIIKPTNINFFIGKNGTGKSTIGRAIANRQGLKWKNPEDEVETIIQVYNENFIRSNLQVIDNMPGVFNISEADIKIENEINDLIKKVEDEKLNKEKAINKWKEYTGKLLKIKKTSEEQTWSTIKSILDNYPNQTCVNKKSKEKAYDVISKVTPKEHSIQELDTLYNIAFDPNAKIYPKLNIILLSVPTYDLSSPIVGKSNSQFSEFIKKLSNIDWVREGHVHFEKNEENKCPYCQRPLTEEIVNDISDCFDESYQEAINKLKEFHREYTSLITSIKTKTESNLNAWYPNNDKHKYNLLCSELITILEKNESIINDKLSHLSSSYKLSSTKDALAALNAFISKSNTSIENNNSLVGPSAKENFNKALLEHLASLCKSFVETRKTDEKKNTDLKITEEERMTKANNNISVWNKRISELSNHTTSTKPVVEHINKFLHESGFQGFSIGSSDDKHYKLIRNDGSIADSLSEGEKNFICFLYFYFSLFGSFDGSKNLKDRIVVIDDPVSSMDSDSVFIISYLIRHLIEVCKNAITYSPSDKLDTHIKQLFILTHNSFFYNEIAPIYIDDFECTNFYEIIKRNNLSNIEIGIKTINEGAVNQKQINYIPKLGSYATLWEEYKEASTASIMLNVQRRIIEAYFLQNLGITPGDLYREILEINKDSFEITENGSTDYVNVTLAKAMLCYIGTSSSSMNSNLYYSTPTDDLQRFKNTFELIFKVMGQESHYKMMMRNN